MSRRKKKSGNSLGDFLGDVDINEVLRLLSALINRMDSKQQEDNARLMELMKDEKFESILEELRKEYKKED